MKKIDKYVAVVLAIPAILIPCILAGIRAPEVGTDVNVYIKPVIEEMSKTQKDLFSLLYSEIFIEETNGVFFTLLIYFFSKFNNALIAMLFTIEFLCIYPVYKVIQKQDFSNELKALSLFCYYCLFYHLSLNLMKQCVAVSMVFLGFEYLKKQKNLKYFFLVLIVAILIHKTAILGIITYFIFIISTDSNELFLNKLVGLRIKIEKKEKRFKKNLIFLLIITGIVFIFMNLRKLLIILVTFKHSYIYQLSHMKNFQLKYSNFLVMILILLPVVLFKRKKIFSDFKYRFYTFTTILSALLYQFVGLSPALYRLSLYSLIFIILAIPNYVNLFKKNSRLIVSGYYFCVMFISFFFDVVLNSYAGVYPYSVSI